MDNLFNSRKLFAALYLAKALAHGVVRTTGRGLPPSVRQLEEKNVKEAQILRGRTAAARLVNSMDCPDLSRRACTGSSRSGRFGRQCTERSVRLDSSV